MSPQVTTISLTSPKWSARDLAHVLGYVEWRHFADSIRKAREQVASHNVAGQPGSGSVNGFENAERIVQGSAVARTVAR